MSSPPWMPLDVDDYLADTAHLTAAEHGAYMLLIMRYWKDGCLPADERMIARFSRLSPDQWIESRDVLAAFFEDGWRHKRIDTELEKAAAIIEKRRGAANARHGGSKPDAHAEQVQSSSSDTGVPPSPSTETTSLRSEERTRAGRAAPAFDEFWSLYPHKVGKADAAKAFVRASKRADHKTIMAGLVRYAAKTDDRAWCNPATWLNQDRWTDEPAAPQARGSPATRQHPVIASADRLLAEMRAANGPDRTQIADHRRLVGSVPGDQRG